MSFYEDKANVDKYIELCKDYDGSNIYERLKQHLKEGKSVLELGTGPGFDIPFLNEHYHVTGSDFSDEFLVRCKEKYPDINFIKIDARNIDTSTEYDCIYSNKVLHHLTRGELSSSLLAQAGILSPGGMIAHSFWLGEEDQNMEGLLFSYYRKEELLGILSKNFDVVATLSYREFEEGDSLFVVAKVKAVG